MCGEQCPRGYFFVRVAGSPPRVRGTGSAESSRIRAIRITPACAGNRLRYRCMSGMVGDHPRVCGEQFSYAYSRVHTTGSPPRVRGTANGSAGIFAAYRITPACAGNRKLAHSSSIQTGDHPRVCGEQSCIVKLTSMELGSPPRVRGTVTFRNIVGVYVRITPACAGNSAIIRLSKRYHEDHPRVCGEQ